MTLPAAFWDTSMVVPLCIAESASTRAESLAKQFSLTVWWGCPVEAHSSFARLLRSGNLSSANHSLALTQLDQLEEQWQMISPNDPLRTQAKKLLDAYPLRAADSLQLAAAIIWCDGAPAGKHFFCADIRLSQAATQAGFTVLTP